jgi:uncharacterized YkwD family protein
VEGFFMNKKIILLIALSLVLAGALGIPGLNNRDVSAAPLFQKVDSISGVVTATRLNVRQGPSTNFPVVCILREGQWVNILAKIGDWYVVYETDTGCVGVASTKYIKTSKQIQEPQGQAPQKSPSVGTAAPKPVATPVPDKTGATAKPPSGITADDQALLELINKARADAGLKPLQFDMELMEVARLKAKDMVDNNYFAHQSPTYGSPFDMMRQFNISFKTAGENIAGNRTVEGAFKAWMNSEGHRKNILNGNFNYTGIGIVDSPKYGKMFAHMFIGR